MEIEWGAMINAAIECLVFSLIGLVMFVIAYFVIDKMMPFSIHKEIEEDQNTALGLVIGSFILGIAIIVAAAING